MKRIVICLMVCGMLLLTGCAGEKTLTRYTHSFFGTFDTFIVLTAYTDDEAAFQKAAQICESEFRRYHELFDPYTHSDTVNNIYNLNNGAWKEPMPVTEDMMELLVRCRDMQQEIPDGVNIAMGRILRLWHNAREDAEANPFNAYLPDMAALEEAALHCDMADLILDEENMTVYYTDELLRLELGAVAKGYAAEKVAEKVAELLPRFSLNAGGNIVVGQAPGGDTGHWKAGIQNPDEALISDNETHLCTIWLENQSLVTSGDYQRYYVVGDKRYHHIIDEKTLMPAGNVRAVAILTDKSFMADFLSTTAFVLPYAESRALIESLENTEAIWVLPDGTVEMTEGFAVRIIEDQVVEN